MDFERLNIEPYVKADALYLKVRNDTPLSILRAVLKELADNKPLNSSQPSNSWIAGDAYLFARSKSFFEEQGYSRMQFSIDCGYPLDSLSKHGVICGQYDIHQRLRGLSFRHHQIAAALPAKDRNNVLNEAIQKNMPASELRNLVKHTKQLIGDGKEQEHDLNARAAICPLCDGSGIVSRQRA